jgi:hypothetical protein
MKPNATPTPDGTAYDLNASAVMLLLADSAHGKSSHDTPPTGQVRAAKGLADLLAAARAGGYTQADILETLLTQGDTSKRVATMCAEAMAAAGNERIGAAFAAMREGLRG